jgi:hypothetical protein
MAQKYFYVVEHYVPFPQSEYGGIWNVIAKDDDECFDLITEKDNGNFNEKFYAQLRENIINAPAYLLDGEVESIIVEEFTT